MLGIVFDACLRKRVHMQYRAIRQWLLDLATDSYVLAVVTAALANKTTSHLDSDLV